jgi:hypothetical protein
MMRAWGNRPDTVVVDEPFYAFYLKEARANHPGAEEVVAAGEIDWRKVVAELTGPIPRDAGIFFQKQMAHHLLPQVDRRWLLQVTNCFLIRNPAEVIASYTKKNPAPNLSDLGFVQQKEIFDFIREQTNKLPPVIDAKDVLLNPERILRLLCDAVGVGFDRAMLSWPPGLRDTDGVWAKYWYQEVAKSTGFKAYVAKQAVVPEHLCDLYHRCRECYEELYEQRLC